MIMLPLDFLNTATPQQVASLSPEQLQHLKQCLYEDYEQYQSRKRTFEAGLQLKYLETAKEALHASRRDTGTTRIKDGDYAVAVEIRKKVEWDQKILTSIIEQLSPDVQLPGLNTTYVIKENDYKKWPSHIQAMFVPARTIQHSTITFDLQKENLA